CLLIFAFCILISNPLAIFTTGVMAQSTNTRRASAVEPRANPAGPVIAAPPDAWPQFRGNYNLTGVSPSQLPAALKAVSTVDAGDINESAAAIDGGTVYVGSGKSEHFALDLNSGQAKWRYKTPEAIGESSPTVGGGLVFVGDLSGIFHAVNAAT